MTHEDKELLLKDLCTRIPYGVVCKTNDARKFGTLISVERSKGEMLVYIDHGRNEAEEFDINEGDIVKPYLRPMSSMTEEEKGEYFLITERFYDVYTTNDTPAYTGERMVFVDDVEELIDFYNSHHFDYRGLIEKALAIEITEENNPYNNK